MSKITDGIESIIFGTPAEIGYQVPDKETQIKNIIALLALLFGEDLLGSAIFKMSPDYLIEKFSRVHFISPDSYKYGMHEILREKFFNRYMDKWGIKHDSDMV